MKKAFLAFFSALSLLAYAIFEGRDFISRARTDSISASGRAVSSTMIRDILSQGDVVLGGSLLGYRYALDGVVLYDAEQNYIGERHQGFDLIPVSGDEPFRKYNYRLYFLANENRRARYVRLMFIADPDTELTLRDISLDITPYDIDRMDSTYIKFKEKEAKQNRK